MDSRLRTMFLLVFLTGQWLNGCAPTRPEAPALDAPGITPSADSMLSPALRPTRISSVTPQAGLLKGVGILGDSFYDEYRADDARGGAYAPVTFNLVELLALQRGFNLGRWGTWGGSRRSGYEYNWAHSGATSITMIDEGQHTGLAEQVRSGAVTFVFIGIGANDFSPYYGSSYIDIYNGTLSEAQLAQKIDNAIANVTLAVDTVQQAGAQGVAMTLFTQWELDPLLAQQFPDAGRRQRVASAIDQVNSGLQTMARSRQVVVVDQNAFGAQKILPRLDAQGRLNVGGEWISFTANGDEPHHSRLADGQHLGTVVSGLAANYYFIDTLNQNFGLNLAPLSDQEILAAAGLLRKTYLPILRS